MAKFLDKKERVYDIKLTNYGHYLLSIGRFKPTYYSFYDDNIIYDSNYTGFSESQNEAHERIKNKTAYLESLVLFEDIEKTIVENDTIKSKKFKDALDDAIGGKNGGKVVADLVEEFGLSNAGGIGDRDEISITFGDDKDSLAAVEEKHQGQGVDSGRDIGIRGGSGGPPGGGLFSQTLAKKSQGEPSSGQPYGGVRDDVSQPYGGVTGGDGVIGAGAGVEVTFDDFAAGGPQVFPDPPMSSDDLDEYAKLGNDFNKIRGMPSYFDVDVTPTMIRPKADAFKFDSSIGDAYLDSRNSNMAPAWKIVVLNGKIDSSAQKYHVNASSSMNIPQINMSVQYEKKIVNLRHVTNTIEEGFLADGSEYDTTEEFVDGKIITLKTQHPVIYIDEVNTELLKDNFDIEVFKVNPDGELSLQDEGLQRKFFETKIPQVVNGMMVSANPIENPSTEVTTESVEYYFSLLKDKKVSREIVCKQLQILNKSSYYIDIDIDCETELKENIYNDIYGSEVVPEICLD